MATASKKNGNGSAIEVLAVDDVATEAFTLRKVLESGGYKVTVAREVEEARRLIASRPFRLVVTDVDMPGRSGYELCAALKRDVRTQHIPVMLLTLLSSPANLLQGLAAKADYYLTKPYEPALLLERARELIARPPGPPEADSDPLRVSVAGEEHEVTAGRQQLVNLLLSTYECALQQNRALLVSQGEVRRRNKQLREQREKLRVANAQLQALATRDGLTGLFNHRTLKERMAEEFERSARHGVPLSLLLLDIDRFKQFNDEFGHPAGDDVLRNVAQLLADNSRTTDFAARYGGEEFAVLLPFTKREPALALGERIRSAIDSSDWKLRRITASIGIATFEKSMASVEALLVAADAALYRSKKLGRNRVTYALGTPPARPTLKKR